jgi:hypothetical protein
MNAHLSSEERLTTLRGLVERKEIYQRRFARTGLIGGSLSILTAALMFVNDEFTQFLDRPVRPREFASAWIFVLAATVAVGALLAVGAARTRDDVFGSARMKLALGTIAPYLIIPAAFTGWFFATGYLGGTELDLAVVWIAFYGLLLLSTAWFAPRSIVLLGWAFLLTAVSVPLLEDRLNLWTGEMPTALMGVTFGLYHLFYAALNWRRNAASQ